MLEAFVTTVGVTLGIAAGVAAIFLILGIFCYLSDHLRGKI